MPLEIRVGHDIREVTHEADGTPVRGIWTGKGAEAMGLVGECTDEDLTRVYGTLPDPVDSDDDVEAILADEEGLNELRAQGLVNY